VGVNVKGKKRKKRSLKKKINDALADPNIIRAIKFFLLGFIFVIGAIILIANATKP